MVDFHVKNMRDFIGKRLMDLKGFDGLLVVAVSRDGEIIIPMVVRPWRKTMSYI